MNTAWFVGELYGSGDDDQVMMIRFEWGHSLICIQWGKAHGGWWKQGSGFWVNGQWEYLYPIGGGTLRWKQGLWARSLWWYINCGKSGSVNGSGDDAGLDGGYSLKCNQWGRHIVVEARFWLGWEINGIICIQWGGTLGLCDDPSIRGSQVEVLDCIQWGGLESALNVTINVAEARFRGSICSQWGGGTLWWYQGKARSKPVNNSLIH